MCYAVVKTQDRDSAAGKWQNDLAQDLEIRSSVDFRGFLQFVGQGTHKTSADNDIVGTDKGQQDQYHRFVYQTQAVHRQKGGDQTAAEPHGDRDKPVKKLSAVQIFAGQGVTGHNGAENIAEGADHSIDDAVSVAQHNILVGQDHLVTLKVEPFWEQPHLTAVDHIGITDGRNSNKQQRVGDNDADQNHQGRDIPVNRRIFFSSFLYHKKSPFITV